jgi:hypothetical protein
LKVKKLVARFGKSGFAHPMKSSSLRIPWIPASIPFVKLPRPLNPHRNIDGDRRLDRAAITGTGRAAAEESERLKKGAPRLRGVKFRDSFSKLRY